MKHFTLPNTGIEFPQCNRNESDGTMYKTKDKQRPASLHR